MSRRRSKPTIEFQTRSCDRCSGERILGQICPECGKKPESREIDAHLQRRQRILPPILERLLGEPDSGMAPPKDVAELRSAFIRVVKRFVAGADDLSKPASKGEQLLDAVDQYQQLRGALHLVEPQRPHLAFARTTRLALEQIELFAQIYLSTLTASTPLQSQELAARAQSHINRCGEVIDQLIELEQIQDQMDYTSVETLGRSILSLILEQERVDVIELVNGADELVTRLLGTNHPIAVGLPFKIAQFMSALELDADSFTSTFVGTYRILTQDRNKLAALAGISQLSDDVEDGLIVSMVGCWNLQVLAQNPLSDRQLVDAALDLNERLVEGPGALLARTLLLASGRKTTPYLKLRTGNATEQLRWAREDEELLASLAGLDDHLRTARGHQQIRYHQTSIEATTNKASRTYSHDKLVDQLLMAVDSTTAGMLALRQALAEAGLHISDNNISTALGLEPVTQAALSLSFLTGQEVTVEIVDNVLAISVAAPHTRSLMSLTATAVAILGDDDTITRFEFTNHVEGSSYVLSGPTEDFTSGSSLLSANEDDFDTTVAYMRSALKLKQDQQPVVTQEVLRKFCAIQALTTFIELGNAKVTLPSAAKRLRTLRQLASDDSELDTAIRQCNRCLAQQEGFDAVNQTLVAWIDQDVSIDLP